MTVDGSNSPFFEGNGKLMVKQRGTLLVQQHPGNPFKNAGLAHAIFASDRIRPRLKREQPIAMGLKIFSVTDRISAMERRKPRIYCRTSV